MAHGLDFVEGVDGLGRTARESLEHERHGGIVVWHGNLLGYFDIAQAVFDLGFVRADAVAEALGKQQLVFGVDELEFQRRGTSVDYEYIHGMPSCANLRVSILPSDALLAPRALGVIRQTARKRVDVCAAGGERHESARDW